MITLVNRITIIGSGPRGLSILERLACRFENLSMNHHIEIYLIDDGYIGTGRIWSPEQSKYLLMNTHAKEITAFSGNISGNSQKEKAGQGLTFYQWWTNTYNDFEDYEGYAPRKYYGEYLLHVLSVIENNLPINVSLFKKNDRVLDIEKKKDNYILHLQNSESIVSDKIVVATGHSDNFLDGRLKKIQEESYSNEDINFVQSSYLTDANSLSFIKKEEKIGVLGLGLSFYDTVVHLTTGRGGTFKKNKGDLVYIKSGNEPIIFAGSRSGMPIPARGYNQKSPDYSYIPAIFTKERAMKFREKGNIRFDKEILPLIEAELSLVYAETLFRKNDKEEEARNLRKLVIKHNIITKQGVQTFSDILGINEIITVNLYDWKYPFKNCEFDNIDQYNIYISDLITKDIEDALQGNVNSPKKAALDVLRNIRNIIRIVVDYGGINPNSYSNEFLKNFDSASKFLSAGPPLKRSQQLQALINAGIIKIIGPNVDYYYDNNLNKIKFYSKNVSNSTIKVSTFIDARVPNTKIKKDTSSLIQNLRSRNIISPFVNKVENEIFETSGVNVTNSPYHPINKDSEVLESFYIIGIPTEYTRWFMQSGSTRPSKWIDFMEDADSIAKDIVNFYIEKEEYNVVTD